MRKFKKDTFNPKPINSDVTKEQLLDYLHERHIKQFFHIHNWVYWTFGPATKIHRVCSKCYKKQKDTQVIPKFSPRWIKDTIFDK